MKEETEKELSLVKAYENGRGYNVILINELGELFITQSRIYFQFSYTSVIPKLSKDNFTYYLLFLTSPNTYYFEAIAYRIDELTLMEYISNDKITSKTIMALIKRNHDSDLKTENIKRIVKNRKKK